jgi:phage host-nuclease inhibitor protein Gam
MADTKTAKATVAKGDSAATPASAPVTKPERPNDEEYKANLAKAEKELKAAEEKMVSIYSGHAADLCSFGKTKTIFVILRSPML